MLLAGTDAIGEARGLVRDDLGTTLSPGRLSDAALMTSELVSNAVVHAQLDDGAEIGLDITVAAGHVRVSVVDAGEGFSQEHEADDLGGWGLVIVEQLSDRWGVHSFDPHSVWFEIDR